MSFCRCDIFLLPRQKYHKYGPWDTNMSQVAGRYQPFDCSDKKRPPSAIKKVKHWQKTIALTKKDQSQAKNYLWVIKNDHYLIKFCQRFFTVCLTRQWHLFEVRFLMTHHSKSQRTPSVSFLKSQMEQKKYARGKNAWKAFWCREGRKVRRNWFMIHFINYFTESVDVSSPPDNTDQHDEEMEGSETSQCSQLEKGNTALRGSKSKSESGLESSEYASDQSDREEIAKKQCSMSESPPSPPPPPPHPYLPKTLKDLAHFIKSDDCQSIIILAGWVRCTLFFVFSLNLFPRWCSLTFFCALNFQVPVCQDWVEVSKKNVICNVWFPTSKWWDLTQFYSSLEYQMNETKIKSPIFVLLEDCTIVYK